MEPGVSGGLRSLLVGVDAACFPVLDPLLDAGELPNLERLVDRGVAGPLRSQIPPWTPSAWPTAFTGTNPGKHGLFDFLAFDGYDWAVVDATRLRERPIWETASTAGLTSVVVNVPVTHPPRSFDGALIPGYTAPESPPCYPAGLLGDVRDAVGDYRVYLPG
ncbi:MAG TPA: alkaline phosphatase family protein, partial [Halobacteriales archaeon]|nr:alkaline phosphatase family protein [Halobacteriales archaeon]